MNKTISILTITQLKRIPFIHNLSKIIQKQINVKIDEWVIINGCITDKEHDLFNKEIKKVKCGNIPIIIGSNKKLQYKNIGAFRNFGNTLVSKDLIICMDDDDYYFPTYIKTIKDAFKNNPKIDLVGCSGMLMYDFGLDTIFKLSEFGPNHTVNCCLAYRKEYIKYNKYNETCAIGEEKSFLRNYINEMYQLPIMDSTIHMSYGDNTYNGKKTNMLKNIALTIMNGNIKSIYNPIYTPLSKLIKDPDIYDTFIKLFNNINNQEITDIIFYYGVLENPWDPHSKTLQPYQQKCLELGKEFIRKGYTVSVYGQFNKMKDMIDMIHLYNVVSWNIRKKCKYLILMDFSGFMPIFQLDQVFTKINADKIFVDVHTGMYMFYKMINNMNKDKLIFVLKNKYHILLNPPESHAYDNKNYKTIIIPDGINDKLFKIDYNVKREPKRFCCTDIYDNCIFLFLTYTWAKIIQIHPDAELHCYYSIINIKLEEKQKIDNLLKQQGIFNHGLVSQEKIAIEMQKSTFLYNFTNINDNSCLSIMKALNTGCIPIIWDKNQYSLYDGLKISDSPSKPETYINLHDRLILSLNDKFKESNSIVTINKSSYIYINAFNNNDI